MWYVIRTMTGEEQLLLDLCKVQLKQSKVAHHMFIPTTIIQKYFHKEWHDITKTLFPGYVFVETDDIKTLVIELYEVLCYSKVLKVGDDLTPVTKEEQDFLLSLMDENYCVGYSAGFLIDRNIIVITQGALKNQVALVKRVDRHKKLAYLDVSLFGRMTPVEVGFDSFAKVTSTQWEKIREDNILRARQSELSTGRAVTIAGGVFDGMSGELIKRNDTKQTCTVMFDLFDRPTRVDFNWDEVQVIEQ